MHSVWRRPDIASALVAALLWTPSCPLWLWVTCFPGLIPQADPRGSQGLSHKLGTTAVCCLAAAPGAGLAG